jgi:WD40 repeat protein
VILWDVQNDWEMWRVVVSEGRDPERYANSVEFTPGDKSLIVGTGGGFVKELSIDDGREIRRYETRRGDSVSAFVSSDDRYVALRNTGRGLILLDRKTGEKLHEVSVNGDRSASGFFTPDLQHVVIASSGKDGFESYRINEDPAPSYMRNSVNLPVNADRVVAAISRDATTVAVSTSDGQLFILGKE